MSAENGHFDDLLEELRQRPSRAAWERLYELVVPRLRLYTFSLLRRNSAITPDETDDIVHEVLTRFVQNFYRYEASIKTFDHLRNYLIKACRNEVANRIRHTNVQEAAREFLERRISDVLSQRSNAALQKIENRQLLEELFGKLGRPCQELMRFYLLEGGTLSQYAARANVPPGTVYSRWHRCLSDLRNLVK